MKNNLSESSEDRPLASPTNECGLDRLAAEKFATAKKELIDNFEREYVKHLLGSHGRVSTTRLRTNQLRTSRILFMVSVRTLFQNFFNRKQVIQRAPGARLLVIVDFLFSAKTVEEVFIPLASDWRIEYYEALQAGRGLKARWISARYIWRCVLVTGLSKVFSFMKDLGSAKW